MAGIFASLDGGGQPGSLPPESPFDGTKATSSGRSTARKARIASDSLTYAQQSCVTGTEN